MYIVDVWYFSTLDNIAKTNLKKSSSWVKGLALVKVGSETLRNIETKPNVFEVHVILDNLQ